jgi:integrase
MPKVTNTTPGVGRHGGGKWRARYRGPDGRERTKVFSNKNDAVMWRTTALADQARGDWIDPRGGRLDVETLAQVWLRGKGSLKPSTVADYTELWTSHIQPDWGSRKIHSIKPSEVTTWLADLNRDGQSPSRLRKLALCLRQILDIAVKDKKLGENPVGRSKDLSLPRLPRPNPKPLTREEFAQLLAAVGPNSRPLTEALVLTGMRIGEASALKVHDVILAKGKPYVRISQGAVTLSKLHGGTQVGTPKSGRSRIVPLTPRGVEVLRGTMKGKSGHDLVFTNSQGGRVTARAYREVLVRACRKARLRHVAPHDLRDTYASWAIQAGANIKMLQEALGHASATLTLDTYAKLLPGDMDVLRSRLAEAEEQWSQQGSGPRAKGIAGSSKARRAPRAL